MPEAPFFQNFAFAHAMWAGNLWRVAVLVALALLVVTLYRRSVFRESMLVALLLGLLMLDLWTAHRQLTPVADRSFADFGSFATFGNNTANRVEPLDAVDLGLAEGTSFDRVVIRLRGHGAVCRDATGRDSAHDLVEGLVGGHAAGACIDTAGRAMRPASGAGVRARRRLRDRFNEWSTGHHGQKTEGG